MATPKQVLKQWNKLTSKQRNGRKARELAKQCGMRSMAEVEFAVFLQDHRKKYRYEPDKLEYVLYYIPDFKIGNTYIEIKGKMIDETWRKMKAVRVAHPDKRIAIVFVRGKNKIRAGSKTTYMMKAEKMGYDVFDLESEESIQELKKYIKEI